MLPKILPHVNSFHRHHLGLSLRVGFNSSFTRKCSIGSTLHDHMDTEKRDKEENVIKSSTAPSGMENRTNNASNTNKISMSQEKKKKRYALLLTYCGANYHGYAINVGVKTVEQYVMEAFKLTGHATEKEVKSAPYSLGYSKVSRTDKGVSALQFVISLNFASHPILEEINQHLPEDIRFMGCQKVIRSFHSQKACTARTYAYILPTFAFSNYKLDYKYNKLQDYRIDADTLYKVYDLLQFFKGSHRFHNYTSGKDMEDRSSFRVMKSLSCSQPYLVGDMEFVDISIMGQSFMLHQIRRMIGMVIAVMRGKVSSDVIHETFVHPLLRAPTAPSLGLMLVKPHFDSYNKYYGKVVGFLDFPDDVPKCIEFKHKYILPYIVGTEINSGSMAEWLNDNLRRHSFHHENK